MNAVFSNDLVSLEIEFKFSIVLFNSSLTATSFSAELCSLVFTQSTYLKMGDGSQCKIDAVKLIVQLGSGFALSVDDYLYFKSGVLKMNSTCTTPIDSFFNTIVNPPVSPVAPTAVVNSPSSVSLCETARIFIESTTNTGLNKPVIDVVWSVISPTILTTNPLQMLLDQANSDQLLFLNIPPKTLSQNQAY